jgi:hypothetical protein
MSIEEPVLAGGTSSFGFGNLQFFVKFSAIRLLGEF